MNPRPYKLLAVTLVAMLALLAFWPTLGYVGILVTGEAPGVQKSQLPGVKTSTFNAPGVSLGLHTSLATDIGLYSAPEPGLAVVAPDLCGGSSLSGLPEPTPTQYMAIGNQSGQFEASIDLGGLQSYFGFYWTAGDDFNQVEFYRAGALLASYRVADFADFVFGNQEYFVNPNTGESVGQPWALPAPRLNELRCERSGVAASSQTTTVRWRRRSPIRPARSLMGGRNCRSPTASRSSCSPLAQRRFAHGFAGVCSHERATVLRIARIPLPMAA